MIVDAEKGYVLTNHHVIADAEEIIVTLTDRRRLTAKLIGSDPGTDVALLDVDATNLHDVPFGNSEGDSSRRLCCCDRQPVRARANGDLRYRQRARTQRHQRGGLRGFHPDRCLDQPRQLRRRADRSRRRAHRYQHGHSTPGGGNVGIGFAVPADMAKQVISQVLEYGEVRRGRLGVYIQSLTPDLAEALELDVAEGAVVTQVEPGSAAERAGLEAGDVITAFNGEPITGAADLRNKTGLARVGTSAALTVLSEGRQREVKVAIEESSTATAGSPVTIERLQGVEFRDLDPQHPLYGRVEGVLTAAVPSGSPAERSGLRAGDVVVAVNRTPVRSVQELTAALRAAPSAIALNVVRGDSQLFIVVR